MSAPETEATNAATERLLDALEQDATPVKRIYPLWRVALGVTLAYVVWWGGSLGFVLGDRMWAALARAATDGFFVGIATSLAGATLWALAGREPGREGTQRVSWALLALGVVAMSVTFAMRAVGEGDAMHGDVGLMCASHAVGYGVVPAGLLLFVVLGGWRGRPAVAAVVAAVSGACVGAALVQLVCTGAGAVHIVVGHFLLPLGAGAAVALLGVRVWRRIRER